MTKKSLVESFFSIIFRLIKFIVGKSFVLLSLIAKFIYSIFLFIIKNVKNDIQKKKKESKKPVVNASYKKFEVLKTLNGSFDEFEKHLLESKSTIGLILGSRGSGKSALGMRILENIYAREGKPVFAMGFLEESLPKWIKNVNEIGDVQNGAFVLIDEGGILFSSRGSMTNANKILSEFILIARHKDLSVLFISQNSANLEVNAIRQADYLLLRKSSLLQKDFERKKIKEVYLEAETSFNEFTLSENKLTYVYSDMFRGYIKNSLPSFWNEKTSKSFKNLNKKDP
ncbi:MAG: zonular occludens toxin domain-containing protein [Candidatus Micrarchaeota archaeon]|nr:zonular occludens toxin domain-containing protein [Candidatus Micrarchaeota archaeon]